MIRVLEMMDEPKLAEMVNKTAEKLTNELMVETRTEMVRDMMHDSEMVR